MIFDENRLPVVNSREISSLFITFEKAAIVFAVYCKLYVALYGLRMIKATMENDIL